MDEIATMSNRDRGDLFREAAVRRGQLNGPIIEKDFWVCWTLKQIFSLPDSPVRILFKGGTSLSKAFNAIERFSEDVDLSLFREDLGYDGDRDPANAPSGKKATNLIKQLDESCCDTIHSRLLPLLTHEFSQILDQRGQRWALTIDPEEPKTLIFAYPPGVDDGLLSTFAYVKPVIRLEMGARSDNWPSNVLSIRPYAAETFPDLIANSDVTVHVLAAERTFWDKVVVLHREHHRPSEKKASKERISRHYYDVACLFKTEIGSKVLAQPALLKDVVSHQILYFPRAWAQYELAVPGTLRILPLPQRISELERDYRAMSDYFFGEVTDFAEILKTLGELESQINRI